MKTKYFLIATIACGLSLSLAAQRLPSVVSTNPGNGGQPGSENNPYDHLYVNDYIKVGTNSIWLDAASPNTSTTPDNRLFTTSGPLRINGNWPSSGSVPASLGQNTLINPTGGHVGIGTETPIAKLDVELNTSYLTVHESGLRVTYPNLLGAPTSDGTPINESIFEVREKFPASGTFNSRLIVKSNGNVGISTADPKYKLHIVNANPISGTAIRADAINGHLRLFETDGSNPNTDYTQIERNGDAFHIYQRDASGFTHVLTGKKNGNVGIGITNPSSKLHLENGYMTIQGNFANANWNTWNTRIASPLNSAWVTTTANSEGDYMNIGMTENGWFFGYSPNPIGHSNATDIKYAMSVEKDGLLTAREIQVTLSGWSDFVFEDDYKLKPLEEVKAFIEKNNHLPDVPSEKEVLENGVKLGEMDAILLQKIEELTLYVIELKKENQEQQKMIDELSGK